MIEGAPPVGGPRRPVAPNGRSTPARVTLMMVDRLSAVHQKHLTVLAGIGDTGLRAGLNHRLEVTGLEIKLLESRLQHDLPSEHYRLENLHDSIVAGLNGIRLDIFAALGEELAPLPLPVEAPPSPMSAPTSTPSPEPRSISVTPAGVVAAPRKSLLESDEYLAWQQSLKPEQAIGLGFVEGLEGGRLIERIFKTQELMIHKEDYGAALIDLVLDAVYKLRQRKIPGLHVLLARLSEVDERGRMRETMEVRGAAVEIIRLGYIAEEETSDPLTEAGRKFNNITFYPMHRLMGEAGVVRYVPERIKRLTEDADADGYRGSSHTLIEIKYSSQPLVLNGEGNGQVMRLLNQARKYGAAIRKGIINQVEFIIIAPEIDPEIIKLIYGMVRGSLFHFTDITSRSGNLHPLINPKLLPGRVTVAVKTISDGSAPPKWNEAAWVWALGKYTGEAKKFKGFDNDPRNLRKDVRQPQTSAVLSGLQKDLDQALSLIPDRLAQARSDEERTKIEELRIKIPALKRNLAEWRRNLDTNSLGIKTICDFSVVLQEVREFLGS